VAACVLLILGLGGAEFGSAQTSRYLLPLLRWLLPDLSWRSYYELMVWIRKGAHVTEYALLGWLAFRAVRLSLTTSSALARIALLALALAAGVALADEIRQSFLGNRTGSPWDVALDVSGALLAIGFTVWWRRRAQLGAPAPGST
jgi:VanZ family protein